MTELHADTPKAGIRVAVCVPCMSQMASVFAFDLTRMVAATGRERPDIELRLFFNMSSVLPRQRHELVLQATEAGCTHILWLDSDMRFPKHTLARLLAHGEPIVGANYVTRIVPAEPVAMFGDQTRCYTRPASEGLEQVLALGFGVCLVSMDVFRQLGAPWFGVVFDPERQEYIGEDVYFCLRAREAGVTLFVDHDLSKQVAHVGEFEYRHEHAAPPASAVIETSDGA